MAATEPPPPDSPSSPPPQVGPADAALALLLERARGDPALAAQTSAFLAKQGEMLDLQMENLHEQRIITLNHLKRQELSDRLKLTLQMLGVAAGVAVALFAAAGVWDARRSNALVIEPISTPQEFAAQGLTPTAASAQLLDKLRAMQARTDSARAADTYRSNWGDDIKVEIPQTGVSVGELFRLMRRWLGHDTYISGEIMRTPRGVALTSRVGDQPGRTFVSADGDLDGPMQRAAEAVYANTQPYRYSVFLSQNGRAPEAAAVLRQVAEQGAREERAWALVGLGGVIGAAGDFRNAAIYARQGLALDPDLAAGWMVLSGIEQTLGRDEAAYQAAEKTIASARRKDCGGVTETAAAHGLVEARATAAELRGDYAGAVRTRSAAAKLDRYQHAAAEGSAQEAIARIRAHEPIRPEAVRLAADDVESPLFRARLIAARAYADDDWSGAAGALERLETAAAAVPGATWRAQAWPTQVWPWRAYAYARTGRLGEARALIARTPLDCYLCLRVRGLVAALEGDQAARDGWFGRAVKAAPSLPFAQAEWGRALAAAGDYRRAEKAFEAARRLGPNWAEPLAWSGRALAAQGRTREAQRRFKAASRLAPQWTGVSGPARRAAA